jgi:hypothetical protein
LFYAHPVLAQQSKPARRNKMNRVERFMISKPVRTVVVLGRRVKWAIHKIQLARIERQQLKKTEQWIKWGCK